MLKTGLIGHQGLCGVELLQLLEVPPKLFLRDAPLDFSDIDVLFMAIGAEETVPIAQKAINAGVIVIDMSSAFRTNPSIPLILPPVNSHLINNSLKIISLPNCIVSILLTVLSSLHKTCPIKQLILSTYQAASGAGKAGLTAISQEEVMPPFPYPLKDNLFNHESAQGKNGLCGEEEKIIFETRKILNEPELTISVRCVRVPVKRAHSIHVLTSFEQNIHNIDELLKENPYISLNSSAHPLLAEGKKEIFVSVRKDLGIKNTYDFWIVGDQLLRGAALNAYEAYLKLCSLLSLKDC